MVGKSSKCNNNTIALNTNKLFIPSEGGKKEETVPIWMNKLTRVFFIVFFSLHHTATHLHRQYSVHNMCNTVMYIQIDADTNLNLELAWKQAKNKMSAKKLKKESSLEMRDLLPIYLIYRLKVV